MGPLRHDPAAIAVGAGTAGYYATRNFQDAIDAYCPVFAGYLAFQERLGVQPVFPTLEDFVERSSALIGSPAQVIEKVHRYHEQFGHSVLHLHADAGGLTDAQIGPASNSSSPTSPRCSGARSPTLPGDGAAARSATTRFPPELERLLDAT